MKLDFNHQENCEEEISKSGYDTEKFMEELKKIW